MAFWLNVEQIIETSWKCNQKFGAIIHNFENYCSKPIKIKINLNVLNVCP